MKFIYISKLCVRRSVLLESIASDMGMLKQLEDKTLDLLQKSEGMKSCHENSPCLNKLLQAYSLPLIFCPSHVF